MELFEQTSQFKFWRFTREQLRERRQKALRESLPLLLDLQTKEKSQNDQYNPPVISLESDLISVEEQLAVCAFYGRKIMDFSTFFRFPLRVQATALAYFNRFYVNNSVLIFNPKLTMVTALFLATKTENHHISLARFTSELKHIAEPDQVTHTEFTLINGISFHLQVQHAYLALHGRFLDAQNYIADVALLQEIYEEAIAIVHLTCLTDLYFLYQPSQVALACFVEASTKVCNTRVSNSVAHEYLAEKYPGGSEDLLETCAAISSTLKETNITPDPAQVKLLVGKLNKWHNPQEDAQCVLYNKSGV